MSKRAVIYARASLDISGEGRSVERQAEAVRTMLANRGIEVVAELQDNSISAYGEKRRPGWEKVLGMIERREIDYVAAWHIDRMTRSMLDLERLILLTEASNVGILTATGDIDLTTDVGRMVARILAAVARAEVERKAARQVLANRQLAASGKPWTGGARPFGYTQDQRGIVEQEAEAVRWAARAAIDGVPMNEIARELERRGVESSRAKYSKGGWTGRGVMRMLSSPRYAGIRTYKGEEAGPGDWPAILDMDTYLELKSRLTPRSKYAVNSNGRNPTNLLSGIATCDKCGGELTGASRTKGTVLTYTCAKRCVGPRRDIVDAEVEAAMVALLASPDFLSSLVTEDDADTANLQADLDALHRRMKVLASGFADGTVDEAVFVEVGKTLRERITAAESALRAATTGSSLDGLSVGTAQVTDQWLGLSLERKRTIVGQFLVVVAKRKANSGERYDVTRHLSIERRQQEAPTLA